MIRQPATISILTQIFLVLLRIAIGWHFLYEGLSKLESFHSTRPFRADPYLRRASGPFRDFYRGQLQDPDGLEKLDLLKVEPQWQAYVKGFGDHYQLTEDQRKRAAEILESITTQADAFFKSEETKDKIEQYHAALDELANGHQRWQSSFQSQWLADKQQEVERLRSELVGKVDQWTAELRAQLRLLLDSQQYGREPYGEPLTQGDRISRATAWFLAIVGGCLMLGLFSRLSALAAAAFLAMIYLAMPPWPGLPPNPMAEGSYLIVDKNLIEFLAALTLATTHSGRWAGIDALIHGLIVRPFSRR